MSRREISAGCVVYRTTKAGAEVALIQPRDRKAWALPKGLIEQGEEPEAAAKREAGAYASVLLPAALQAAAEAVRRLRAVEPGAPVNLWLHDGPWWHIHVIPRLTVAAGIELGAGIHLTPLPPAEAAARLRG